MANQSTLQVLIDIRSRLAGLEQSVAQMRQLRQETQNVARVGSSLSGIFAGVLAGFGIGVHQQIVQVTQALSNSVREGIEFNATLESSRIGIASIIKTFDSTGRFKNFDAALAESAKTVDFLKQRALETKATFQELLEGYQAAAGPAFQAGIKSTKDQVNLVIALSQAMAALSIPTRELSQEIRAVFEGDTSRQSRLNQVIRVTKDEIEKAALNGTAYQLVMGRLTAFSEGAARGQQSFSTALSNTSDVLLQLKATGTTDIFEKLKKSILELNEILSRDKTREAVRGFGALFSDLFDVIREQIEGTQKDLEALEKIVTLGGLLKVFAVPAPSLDAGLFDQGAAQQFIDDAQRRRGLLLDEVNQATTLDSKIKAVLDLERERLRLSERLSDKNTLIREQADFMLGLLQELVSMFGKMAGEAGRTAENMKLTKDQIDAAIKATAALHEVQRQTAIKAAEATGNKAAVFDAKGADVYADTFRKLFAEGVDPVKAARAAGALADETKRALEYQQSLRDETKGAADARRELTALVQEESLTLKDIRAQQQLIEQDPALTRAQKNSLLFPLLAQERAELAKNIEFWKAYIKARQGTDDPAVIAEISQAADRLRADTIRAGQIAFQQQSGGFFGGLRVEMVQWLDSVGTAAQQAGRLISSGLNTAIANTSALLTDAIFRTGDWRKAFLGTLEAVVQGLIQMGLQMLITSTLGSFLRRKDANESAAAGAQIAASYAPAAAATSISSFGSSAVIGAIAAAAAIAAIVALLVGFEGGGFTGNVGTKRIAGVVHGKEFVQPEPAVSYYGLQVHEAIRRRVIPADQLKALAANYRYPVRARHGSFDIGGAVAAVSGAADERAQSAGAGANATPVVNNHALFYDRSEAVKWLRTQDGEKFFVDLVKGTSHRLPKA